MRHDTKTARNDAILIACMYVCVCVCVCMYVRMYVYATCTRVRISSMHIIFLGVKPDHTSLNVTYEKLHTCINANA